MTTTGVVAHLVLVALLGYLAWLTPVLSARSVRFGVRVPDDRIEDPVVRRETTRFRTGVLATAGVLAAAGTGLILAAGIAVLPAAMLAMLVVWYLLYLRANRVITAAKRDQDWYAGVRQGVAVDTSLRNDPPRFPWAWLLLPVLVVAATVVVGVLRYPDLPDRLPVHFSGGTADRFAAKSVGSAFGIVFVQAALTVILCVSGVLAFRGPADVDPARPSASARAHRKFVSRLGTALVGLATLIDLGLFAAAWATWAARPDAGLLLPLTIGPVAVGVALLVVVVARRDRDGGSGEHTGLSHRDDDGNWIGGVLYRNADDPSWFVARRFGVGWTVNIGNPVALVTCLGLTAAVVLLGLFLPFIIR
ncbi:DUF1648 domain-containing protein [Amycolatopsis vancoresmycina]|uniref:DUF1648 domain-containing protein n=1 Tax=Amycolatopsis vancoresmycina DSM 44592 TaxID=1292037 RepID=R1HYR9_9PSEU|nr:DUF5808 domain-containing protein [Amycolatopsis vancoresmycina]EOD68675.1 hypothetical protein H480_10125 [Amycolatopsis vancoresmycina DSM 44592]